MERRSAARVEGAARDLVARLGPPDVGIVAGSGFAPLAARFGAGSQVPPEEIPDYPRGRAGGHGGGISVADSREGRYWIFHGRFHLYEGFTEGQVVLPVSLLAAAGARAVLLTCAAGGLLETDRPGDFALITDHLNLTGKDPLRSLPPEERRPAFLDLQAAYDRSFAEIWCRAANECGVPLRDGILAAMPGPAYETPAEVRMLRAMGADLVSMSTVPEVLAARYHDLRVAAIACVANQGAGVGPSTSIRHDDVVTVVRTSVERAEGMFRSALTRMLAQS